jgi:hypothetical protein
MSEYARRGSKILSECMNRVRLKSPLLREFLAEFIGTFTLIVLGDGAVAQWKLTKVNSAIR